MPLVYVTEEDYDYLMLYSDVFLIPVEDVVHRRIEILKSSTSFGIRLASSAIGEEDHRFDALVSAAPTSSFDDVAPHNEVPALPIS